MNKGEYLAAIHNAWASCRGCQLCEERNFVVFGYGNPDAQIMIIGEAPGETEDREGFPFIGAAGQLLDLFLGYGSCHSDVKEAIEDINATKRGDTTGTRRLLRDLLLREFYFTNVVMCRPPENRDPIPKEIEACSSRLREQIYTIDPVIIVTAGGVATSAVVGKKIAITQSRGELYDVEMPGKIMPIRYPVLALLHPSYLLRKNDFKQKGGEGVKTYNDVIRLMNIIDEFNYRHYRTPYPPDRPKKED